MGGFWTGPRATDCHGASKPQAARALPPPTGVRRATTPGAGLAGRGAEAGEAEAWAFCREFLLKFIVLNE
ncbi:hypothetical protein NQZ68_028971 [Dissostichus eleginoides]|nr:hypothetical protein NQZ68_028971 [Dissostichus eleginoides]